MTKLIRDQATDQSRLLLYRRAIEIAVIGNGLLAVAKGGGAWISGSTAVMATAVDSFTDLVYTAFLAWGLWLSQQPADESHPQGHARLEPVISSVIALMMGIAGWEVARQAFSKILGEPNQFEWGLPAAVLVGSALVKMLMYLLVHRLAKLTRSPAINASARDNLTDVMSSGVALAGVLLANWLHPLADPIAGALVALWIFRNVIEILVENLGYLVGRSAEPELVDEIASISRQVDGVLDVHRIVVDYLGPQLRVDMHIDLAADLPLHAAHEIHQRLQKELEALDEVDLAYIHLEPMRLKQAG
jgi:cation diffusion facilitator family transporter